ncbi:MAG: adenine-specific methyltransferase EcoRI family protein [Clostridiales bacterium]|nr:adenine-specific methyltransferase EcoRI family protein [Clostridiales bacterium]
MPQQNSSLNKAKEIKNDEFYTLMEDIENEISKYDLAQFKGKIVYCNCDDPTWSNFFKFFTKWGNRLRVKEVHFTNYANGKRTFNRQLTLFDLLDLKESADDDKNGTAHHWVYTPATNKIVKKELKGDGDFRSAECVELLKKSDIVVTNPPFSLFREYVAQLMRHNLKFLIIGDENNISYKEFFPLIKNNEVWLGYTKVKKFKQPDGDYKIFGNKCWYTNLDVAYRHKPLILHAQDISQYKKYDNYDAIEVSQIKLIPDNYFEPMGVPMSILEKFCPEQFEILGLTSGRDEFDARPTKKYINPIQINPDGNKISGSKANTRATLLLDEVPNDIYYVADNADKPMRIFMPVL